MWCDVPFYKAYLKGFAEDKRLCLSIYPKRLIATVKRQLKRLGYSEKEFSKVYVTIENPQISNDILEKLTFKQFVAEKKDSNFPPEEPRKRSLK